MVITVKKLYHHHLYRGLKSSVLALNLLPPVIHSQRGVFA